MHFPPHFHLPFFLSLCAYMCVGCCFYCSVFALSLCAFFCARKQTVRPHHMQFGFEVWCAFFKTSRRELPACFVRLSKSHLLTVFVLQCSVRPSESAQAGVFGYGFFVVVYRQSITTATWWGAVRVCVCARFVLPLFFLLGSRVCVCVPVMDAFEENVHTTFSVCFFRYRAPSRTLM